ncbi:11218_t:CDS:2 [Scutellospora calospora]|uniref:11218_t:CDS:1 n=1 Tax=Scutellospora calospora TaxID=85575 RepID=A0ACA9KGH7_9GLOM|nr:11218_t:CDS:2 [Scutellospora calospora]
MKCTFEDKRKKRACDYYKFLKTVVSIYIKVRVNTPLRGGWDK